MNTTIAIIQSLFELLACFTFQIVTYPFIKFASKYDPKAHDHSGIR